MRPMDETSHICPWCSASSPAGTATCPKCGAVVEGAIAPEIPGVTVVGPAATLGPDGGKIPAAVLEAILPPSDAVRYEMRKIALEAEIENAGRSVMSASDGVSDNVKKPSREALKAFEAGLLDSTGPAGETDFVERARALEEEEKPCPAAREPSVGRLPAQRAEVRPI